MQNLYQEALADAISLREMAEKNARNKIIESIAPQIKKMIERQMLAEQDEDVASDEDTDIPNLDLDALPDEGSDLPSMGSPMSSTMGSPMSGAAPDPDEEVTHTVTTKTASGTEVKINVRVDKHGEASASAEADAADGDDVDVELNEETLRSLSQMMFGKKKRVEKPSLAIIKQQLECLKTISRKLPLSESKKFKEAYAIMIKNLSNFNKHVISNGSSVETKKNFNKVMKEIKNMSTSARFRRLLEQMENKKKLQREAKLVFEPADLEGLDDEDFKSKLQGMSFGVEFAEEEEGGEEEGSVDVSDTDSAPASPVTPAAPAAPAMAEDDDMEEDDMDEMYDMDEEDMEEMYEEMEDDSELEEETVFHVNESMLRKELRRLKESKKGIKDAMADQFGGGKEEGDPWLDGDVTTESVDENDAEAIAEKALKVAKKATDAAKDEREKRKEEARANRGLKGKLDESSKMIAALREQLDEVNLFNAKLLYVNKLMQNRDLTPRQQRSIVESLDGAKSVREAQLLFNSLTESLKVKSTKMNEGKVFGSASRSTRSGSAPAALNESVEVDRWAILAGIKK